MSLQNLQTSDPKAHSANIKSAMHELIQHMRRDVEQVDEPKAQALFETTAEVLQGLVTAFEHYEAGREAGFRR
jgi:ribosomal protein S20